MDRGTVRVDLANSFRRVDLSITDCVLHWRFKHVLGPNECNAKRGERAFALHVLTSLIEKSVRIFLIKITFYKQGKC